MNEITKQQLLELSHDYVIAWHDIQTHRNGMTHVANHCFKLLDSNSGSNYSLST